MIPKLQYVRLPVVELDLKHRKIHVNAVSPGTIDTPFVYRVLSKQQSKEFLNKTLKSTPMGRMGTADEVAKAVLFLASDYSSYITGIELFVDGGVVQIWRAFFIWKTSLLLQFFANNTLCINTINTINIVNYLLL